MSEAVFAVVLAGGRAERLWPRTRARRPKALLLAGGRTLLAAALDRAAAAGITIERTWIVGPAAHADALKTAVRGARLLLEPDSADSARAVALAAIAADRASAGAVMAVLPADHIVPDAAPMARAMREAIAVAQAGGGLFAFGTPPRGPSTAYGWLRPATAPGGGATALAEYVEKPDADRARALFDAGRHLWNCGTFVFGVRSLLDAFERFARDVLAAARDVDEHREPRDAPRISVDRAILEPATRADLCSVVPVEYERVDAGSFEGLAEVMRHDGARNALEGDVLALDTHDSVLSSGGGALAVLGARDLIVVAEDDVVLVCRRGTDPRKLLAELRARGRTGLL